MLVIVIALVDVSPGAMLLMATATSGPVLVIDQFPVPSPALNASVMPSVPAAKVLLEFPL